MEKKITFTVEHGLTEGDVLDILTTALEGGIGYWACLDNTTDEWVEARAQWKAEHNNETPCYCDVAYQVMKNGKAVVFIDEEESAESDEEVTYELTLEKFIQGCSKYSAWCGKDIHKMMQEAEFDANDADGIIQFALFGEWIYG